MTQAGTTILAAGNRANFVTLDSFLGGGEQAEAWLAHATDQPKLQYVVKICLPPAGTSQAALDDFERERDVLVALNHPNIVRIFDSGKELSRGQDRLRYPFYTMEFLGSDVVTLKAALADATIDGRQKLLLVLRALIGAAAALFYVHGENYSHGDIKESNVLISGRQSLSPIVKLIDFGFARYLPAPGQIAPPSEGTGGPQKPTSIRRSHLCKSEQHNDIFQLCWMVRRSLQECTDPGEVPADDKKDWPIDYAFLPRLHTLVDEWASEKHGSKPDTAEVREFYEQLAAFTPTYAFSPDVRGAVVYLSIPEIATVAQVLQAFEAIRIPPRQLVLYTERIKALTTTPQFGRLRYVRQLGFTHLVYPGAQGTRFEHSLGMYDLACQVVIRMSGHGAFRKVCENKHNVLKFIVAALLHDVGHFSFAHQIEEFSKDDFDAGDLSRVQNLVKGHHHWGRQVIMDLADRLAEFSFDETDRQDIMWLAFSKKEDQGKARLPALSFLHSLLDGPFDLDKLDYIERDAHHCGVPYGSYLDIARLKETMRVLERDGKPVLAFDSRVVGSLEQFASARHELYANVYWHRAVRSATAMFKHAFYLFQQLVKDQEVLEGLFYKATSDDCLLYRMAEVAKSTPGDGADKEDLNRKKAAVAHLLRAVSGAERILYKAILERARESRNADKPYGGQAHHVQRDKAREIYNELRQAGFLAKDAGELGEHNVLIDCHTDEFPHFEEIRVARGPSDETTPLGNVAPSIGQLKENFDRQACKIRVFVNPQALASDYRKKAGRAKITEFLENHFGQK